MSFVFRMVNETKLENVPHTVVLHTYIMRYLQSDEFTKLHTHVAQYHAINRSTKCGNIFDMGLVIMQFSNGDHYFTAAIFNPGIDPDRYNGCSG